MSSRRLLAVGALAGPFFVLSSLVQAAAKAGFDPAKQPPSALALGDGGWVQVVTFVLSGLGFLAGAVGLARTQKGASGRWAARFVGAFGVALVAGGVFPMDPAFGFPPGTADGVGATVSWHAAIHGVLFPLGFVVILAAGWSLSRRYRGQGRYVRSLLALAVGPAALLLSAWPSFDGSPQGRFWPLWTGVALAFGWLSLTLADAGRTSRLTSPTHNSRRTA